MEFSEKLQELRKSRSMTQEDCGGSVCFKDGHLEVGIRQRVSEHRLAKRDIPLFLRNN